MGRKQKRKAARDVGAVPIDPELAALLQQQRQRFIEKFGRPPGPEDPVFFNPFAEQPEQINPEVVEHHLLEAMTKAGVHPSLMYAYQKTHRLVTRDNQQFLTAADLKEWQDAIEEWYTLHPEEPREQG